LLLIAENLMLGYSIKGGNDYNMVKRYRTLSVLLVIITCLLVGSFYLYSTDKIGKIYIQNTQKSIYNLKKDFLKDTVNNQIARIDEIRADKTKIYQAQVQQIELMLQTIENMQPNEFMQMYRKYFEQENNRAVWSAALWETETGRVVYDPQNILAGTSPAEAAELILADFSAYRFSPYGKYQAFFGVKKSYVDAQVKKLIADEIHNSKFAEDSYIWVNEVVNYEGGRNYAIRRIHPNLPETEGMKLSTDMTDIKGNRAYRTELEGIKKFGECFNTYYFKKMNSDVISEKLTYAKLYKDYDWIVAMGIHLDDMNGYINKTNEESRKLAVDLVKILILQLFIILGVSFGLMALLERGLFRKSKKKLEEEINLDLLTKAFSRRAGDRDLHRRWDYYNETGISPAIVYFDIDNFKNINDKYGHDVGDAVLINTVQAVKGAVRTSDKLYRWGGDEFVLVCDGINSENAMGLCDKILREVNALDYQAQGEHVATTISIGVAFFQESDRDYTDALKRADTAVYRSKSNGRNQANIEI